MDEVERRPASRSKRLAIGLAGTILLIVIAWLLPDWAVAPPDSWTNNLLLPYLVFDGSYLPSLEFERSNMAAWLNAMFDFGQNHQLFGYVTIKDMTRGISRILDWPLEFLEAMFISGFPHRSFQTPFTISPLPWVVCVGLASVIGWYAGGRALALLGGGCIAYFALFDLWTPAMTTLSLVLTAAPIAAAIGLMLGILALRWRWLEQLLSPLLNLMQSLPHFGYLIPIVVFVGLAHKSGAVATILFAIPAMTKITMVALRGIPHEVLEAGVMAGCTPRQMLWRVRLPAARRMLMVGINQVIMLCLAMQVIASLIGARGLGIDLLFRLQNLQLGRAIELGTAIVFMAVALDRISQAFATKEPSHQDMEGSFAARHPYALAATAVLLLGTLVAILIPEAAKLPKTWTISLAPQIDAIVRGVVDALYTPLQLFQWLLLLVFLPVRTFFESIPWTYFAGGMTIAAGLIGGWRAALAVGFYTLFIAFSGWWEEFRVTAFLVFVAGLIAIAWGFPLAIWASRRDSTSRAIGFLCDTLQTFPSFIYIIPVIMLFKVGTVAQVMAIMIYAAIPAIRYTVIGLRSVPGDILEAATTSGCTRWQTLWKVQMPMAFPEIVLGINQTVMFGLIMCMIAGLIGGNYDLAREIFKAKASNDAGLGLVLSLCVAFFGLALDQLIQSWANEKKAQLALA